MPEPAAVAATAEGRDANGRRCEGWEDVDVEAEVSCFEEGGRPAGGRQLVCSSHKVVYICPSIARSSPGGPSVRQLLRDRVPVTD